MNETISTETLWPWRPLYWEPVSHSGERIMVGVVHGHGKIYRAIRTIRDDVLECMYRDSAIGIKRLIEHSLSTYQHAAEEGMSIESMDFSITGLHPGPTQHTAATSANELIQTACLLFSSLGDLNVASDRDTLNIPAQNQMNKRFSTEVKNDVMLTRLDLIKHFGQSGRLVTGGNTYRFGYFSPKAILHFTVLNVERQSAAIKDSRTRIFELIRARSVSGIKSTALIASVPNEDNFDLTQNQKETLRQTKNEIEMEADAVDLRWYPVNSSAEGAKKVIELAG